MKIISLQINKIGIGRFYPKENDIELQVKFNDGQSREISKKVDASSPESSAEGLVSDIRKTVKKLNKPKETESIIDNYINIVLENEDDIIQQTSKFIQQASLKMQAIDTKKEATGYLDSIRELKSLDLHFSDSSNQS